MEVNKVVILDELNNNCYYAEFNNSTKGYVAHEWEEEDIDFVRNIHRNFCTYYRIGYWDKPEKILCVNCANIIKKYEDKRHINIYTIHDMLTQVLKRLDKIENDIQKINNST